MLRFIMPPPVFWLSKRKTARKVFIATGNVTPFRPNPIAITLGSGKAALAYLVRVAVEAYDAAGFS